MTQAMFDRILPIASKNKKNEKRGWCWEGCQQEHDTVPITQTSLENFANTKLVHGFFGGDFETTLKSIISLAQCVGAIGVHNPEAVSQSPSTCAHGNLNISQLLTLCQSKIGFEITLPSFLGGQVLVGTSKGIITNRHIYYLEIMEKIVTLYPDKNTRIVEIGAGLGLLGFYLSKLGYYDYTSIDLSHCGMCQSYFLMRNLPERQFILSGEVLNPFQYEYKDYIKLLHTSDFNSVTEDRFDLMVNMDSLVEMEGHVASRYINSNCAKALLSVNHDSNKFRVCELVKNKKRVSRNHFWTRAGYVEEIYN